MMASVSLPPAAAVAGRQGAPTEARLPWLAWLLLAGLALPAAAAEHSFEFIAEHLPEVAMDNRFATLPIWGVEPLPPGRWRPSVQAASAHSASGAMALGGAMAALGLQRSIDARWSVLALAFADAMGFSGGGEQRPLDTKVGATPLALPAQAQFGALRGRYRHTGLGLAFKLADRGWLGEQQWLAGALVQRVALSDYRSKYMVLDGPSAGASGQVDYSASYSHATPFAGLALPSRHGNWDMVAHVLLALPLPRRGVQGQISGPGFAVVGDTATAGNGKHFGDVSLSLGLDVGYRPWGLSIDLGSLLTQQLIERFAHKGVGRNWMLSATLQF